MLTSTWLFWFVFFVVVTPYGKTNQNQHSFLFCIKLQIHERKKGYNYNSGNVQTNFRKPLQEITSSLHDQTLFWILQASKYHILLAPISVWKPWTAKGIWILEQDQIHQLPRLSSCPVLIISLSWRLTGNFASTGSCGKRKQTVHSWIWMEGNNSSVLDFHERRTTHWNFQISVELDFSPRISCWNRRKVPGKFINMQNNTFREGINQNLALWLANYDFWKSLLGGHCKTCRTIKWHIFIPVVSKYHHLENCWVWEVVYHSMKMSNFESTKKYSF